MDATVSFGAGYDTPVPGRWNPLPNNQRPAVTAGTVRLGDDGNIRWLLRYANQPGQADLDFTWGPSTGRPIAGDWLGGDNSQQFGTGFVLDLDTPSQCTVPNPTQGWNLKWTPSPGGINLGYAYDLIRP